MTELFSRVKEISTPEVVQAFLPSLELKQDGSGRHKTLCPFHTEDTPSFTVFEDGWKCFGCGAHGSNVDLLLKAGLASKPLEAGRMIAESFGIEFEQNRPRKEKPLTLAEYAAYVKLSQDFLTKTFHIRETPKGLEMPYLNEAREEVATRIRTRLKAKEGSRWPKGTVPTVYGLWGLERMKKAGNVLLVEGESDTQVCWFNQTPALGIPGAQVFKKEWASLVLPFSLIGIIQEPGEAGERFVKSICAALKEASYQGQIKAVTLLEKDPRDLWLKHGIRFKEELKVAIVRALAIDLKGKATEAKQQRTPITVRVSDVQREEVNWLWTHRIPRGKLTIIEGDPGEGKSFLSQAIATAVSRGFGLPGEKEPREPENVLIMNAEDGLADTIRPRLEDMRADLGRVVALSGLRDEQEQERSLTLADLDVIEKAIVEHRPALVIVDPIIAFTANKDTYKAAEIRSLLAPLAALAEKYCCAILTIRHLNKGTAKAAYRGQGTIDFLASCRSAFLAGEDPENTDRKVLCHIKSNLGPKTPSLTYTIRNGHFLWGEETTVTAEQILAEQVTGEEKDKQGDAKDFLQAMLENGPVDSEEIFKRAKAEGISASTLKRAKEAMGIKAKKAGFEKGWSWELPPKRTKNPEEAHSNMMSPFGKDEPLRDREAGWEDLP